MKELWCFTGNRISVRFEYEWHDSLLANGTVRTEMSIGSSMTRDSCAAATWTLTITLSRNQSAAIVGDQASNRSTRTWP